MTTGPIPFTPPSSAELLEQLMDRQRIADVLARYCQRLDEYNIEAIGTVFSEDAVMDQGPGRGGPVVGRQAILDGMKARQALFRRTNHQLGQSVVELQGNTARALTYVMAWHQTWAGEVQTARLRYHDKLVRVAAGDWRIAHRQSQAMGVEGFGEAQWNWVKRLHPDHAPTP